MSTLELLLQERNEYEVGDNNNNHNNNASLVVMTKGEFVLLGLLQMGQDGGIIGYLSDAYDARRGKGGG